MEQLDYSDDIDLYLLEGGYSLQRAPYLPFVKHWAVYRRLTEDFAQSFAGQASDLEGVTFCFWILLDGRPVGGAVLLPNNLGDLFLIPPFDNDFALMEAILPLLVRWSDEKKPIRAQGIADRHLATVQRFGFRLEESRHWMIRPAARLSTRFDDRFELRPLKPEDGPAIASLLEGSFAGGIGHYGAKDRQAHLASVLRFFEDYQAESPCGRASVGVRETKSDMLAAVCMVNLHKALPAVQFIAVAPEYRMHGLASNLLRRAITKLEPDFDWVKLVVTVGNPAEAIYHKMGFVAGDTLHTLAIPSS
jgi:ribosomal protein S18 acetylase RimI-like enzyme